MIAETIITAATAQMIKSLVEKEIAPRFEKFIKSVKTEYKVKLDKNKDYFGEYYRRTYEKYSIVNTLVFHNSQRLLKDIFVAETLVKDNRFEGRNEATRIDGMPKKLIKQYKKILIEDTAGMGKSTITKRMFIDLIDNGIEGVGVPIYIELNRLNKDRSILQEIQDGLSSLSEVFDKDLLLRFIQTGGFIFFLDGYDEISIADRSEVTQDIQNFVYKAGTENFYILTSRPEDSLKSFGDFQSFKIQPLEKDEAFELLEKYDMTDNKVISKKLIDLLKSGNYSSIDEYLENPLLVSLLYAAFDHKQSIPLKKHLFYRQVYEAYFDSHDLTKGIDAHQKRSGLDIDDFKQVLKYVGYECLIKIGVQFDKDTILSSIENAKAFCGNLNFHKNDLLKDLITAVPLFSKDGLEYKWAHKSLMEYFAATFIKEDAKEKQDDILKAIYKSENFEKYLNMLDLYYDIDFKGFSKNITLPYCEQFIKTCDKNSITLNIDKNLVEERISCLFITDIALFVSSSSKEAVHALSEKMGLDIWKSFNIKHVNKKKVFFGVGAPKNSWPLSILLLRKKSPIVDREEDSDAFDHLHEKGFPKEISEYEHGKLHVIDSRTGSQSEVLYNSINKVLLYLFGKRTNYEACKKEVERIRKEIDQSKTSDLTDGI
ncbi:MAG: NACHT domain-containing protein [Muribaculaceae bacterium]|nr:NACHT domain-containing protein [Muribaculaceae bacterium]